MITIPESILSEIQSQRPSLSIKIDDLRRNPHMARYLEREIATGYLLSAPRFDAETVQSLESCLRGERFGGGAR